LASSVHRPNDSMTRAVWRESVTYGSGRGWRWDSSGLLDINSIMSL